MKKQNIAFEVLVPKSVQLSDRFNMKHIVSLSNANIWEQYSLPNYVNKQPYCILINLCNSAPLLAKNQIVTVHDLAFEQTGVNWFSNKFKRWYRFLIPRIVKSAQFIFTVSEFSKQEIISHYKVNKEKIRVIQNGLNTHIHAASRQIDGDYILLVGGNNPRKNAISIITQIEAIKKLGYKLVILNSENAVFNSSEKTIHPSIIYLNHASSEQYYSLIKYAKALVYPSLYEGFGIPILESLCLQTPVICS
ncbi:MAG: glycosyltransferase family 4 protein, partial [Bacteroidia bacterium]|nr:glycosyltransferase family 4 protein [Bacteroidia bacterium]